MLLFLGGQGHTSAKGLFGHVGRRRADIVSSMYGRIGTEWSASSRMERRRRALPAWLVSTWP